MHKFFGDWYRVAQIEPKGDDLPKRWAGVEELVRAIDAEKALNLARLFLGSTTISADIKEQFALIFQKADPAFPMRDNAVELRVLAGAAVAHCVETQGTNTSDILALAVVSGACPGIRKPVLLPEIVTIVQKYLFDAGLRMRAYSRAPEIKGTNARANQLLSELKAIAEPNSLPAIIEALGSPLQKLHAGMGAVAESANEAVGHLDNVIASAIEQGNILWWVFTERSRDMNVPYSEIPLACASSIAAKELADITELLPGPVAAPAVLDKILAGAKGAPATLSLEAIVMEAENAWKEKCLETAELRLDELCPIHMAFRQSAYGTAWIKPFESMLDVKINEADLNAVTAAVQVYNERLLQKALRV